MPARWTTIAVGALGLSVGATGTAVADWAVHRARNSISDQVARVLGARPEDDALAARLVRGLGRGEQDVLLGRFERRAKEQAGDYSAQLGYAQLLLACGRWTDAVARFRQAAELAPESATPRRGAARALGRGGDARAALVELRAALPLARGSLQIRGVVGELLAAAVAIGDIEAEIEARQAWARAEPRNDKVVFDLALALGRVGRPAEAADVLAVALARTGTSGTERARWALAEGKNRSAAGDLVAASSALERALRDAPAAKVDLRREIWNQQIDIARRRGALDGLRVRVAHPRDVVEWEALAGISEERGDLPGARAALDEAVGLAPRDLDLRRRRIAVVKRIGRAGDVVGLYEDLVRVATNGGGGGGGDTVGIVAEAIEELWRLGRGEAAGRMFDRALAGGRGGVPLLRALAEVAGRWADDRRATLAWTALLRRDPRDELAIVALGEARFERGQRRMAVDTWRALLGRGRASAEAHCRLGDLLVEHDLDRDAMLEARAALTLAPGEVGPHRLMARILERQQRLRDAEDEWETVLRLATRSGGSSERREAGMRLVGLWLRQGSVRVNQRLGQLEQDLRRDEHNRDTLTFLVEAQLRVGRIDDALATLRAFLVANEGVNPAATHGPAEAATNDDDAVDLMLRLVRALRQARRAAEATAWLEEIARRWPTRARDALLQLADIALSEHADTRARAFAERATVSAPDDSRVLLRVAAVQERLGQLDDALAAYRRVVTESHDASGLLALAALLTRRGQVEEQRRLLREALRVGRDDEVIAEAGRRAIVLEEAAGSLEALEAFVAELPDSYPGAGGGGSRRRLLVSILERLIPAAYRNQERDVASRAMMERFARHGSRALLDLVRAPDTAPDVGAVELLGMLARPEAVPVLAILVTPDPAPEDRGAGAPIHVAVDLRDDVANAVVIALGRLGGDQARAALEAVAPRPGLRLSLLWALGRVQGSGAFALARQEIAHGSSDSAVVGCLSLGRASGPEAGPLLLSVAADPGRPPTVRRAAIWGLALGRRVEAIAALLGLLDSGDRDLGRVAGIALGIIGGALPQGPQGPRDRLTDTLIERMVLGDHRLGSTREGGSRGLGAAGEALRRLFTRGPTLDDAGGIVGNRIEPEALLTALETSAGRDVARDDLVKVQDRIGHVVCAALGGSRREREAALRALYDRTPALAISGVATLGSPSGAPVSHENTTYNAIGHATDEWIGPMVRPCLERLAQAKRGERGEDAGPDDGTMAKAALALLKRIDATPGSAEEIAAAVATLSPMLGDSGGEKGWETRLRAVRGLAGLVPKAGVPQRPVEDALLLATLDSTSIVRAEAARALHLSHSARVRRRLEELGRDRSPAVRSACRLDLPR